jgi:hypothetical protein
MNNLTNKQKDRHTQLQVYWAVLAGCYFTTKPATIVKLLIQMFELNECVVGRRIDFLTHFNH